VLRPEQREDGELEVVRVAAEQCLDALQLSVREAECAVERLFGDLRQSGAVYFQRRMIPPSERSKKTL
jgi:hypothetical protein